MIATKNESSSQASKTPKIESMRVKSKGMKLGNFCLKISVDMKKYLDVQWNG